MLKTYNNICFMNQNMFYNYVYSQHLSYMVEFKCNFNFMPVYTSKRVAF